jgi:tetratricopeptide (TPR) repeat protein
MPSYPAGPSSPPVEQLHEQHLAIAREIGDRHGEGIALGNLGITWNDLGERRKAIVYLEQRLAIAREIGHREDECGGLANLGLAWKALGAPHKAIEYFEHALAIAREIGDRRSEGIILFNRALALDALSDQRDAAVVSARESFIILLKIESPYAVAVESWLRERGIDPSAPPPDPC